ncbi:MAG: LicD family protein [Muribaculum sp.]|nr:LicD family protein [Muribaculum sp.]
MTMIDADVHASLRERFSPDGSLLRRHQLKLLEMLRFIDEVCRNNDIPYWLSSGTLIGAMRHGGFIPWDDDVDVEMLAADFPRFREAVERVADPRYVVQTTATDPEFLFAFGKLRDLGSLVEESNGLDALLKYRGCYIDVFTIAPSSSRRLHRLGCKLVGTELKWRVKSPRSLRSRLLRGVLHGIVFPVMSAVSRVGAGDRMRHVIPSFFSAERRLPELLPVSEVSFEGYTFKAPADPDAYLRRIYGDYMRLPDPDKIQVHASRISL